MLRDERKITKIDDVVSFAGIKLEVHLDEHSTRAQVVKEVNRVSEAMKDNEAAGKRLGLLLGHIMALVQDRELWKPEFESFEAYSLSIADRFDLSRATVRADLRIARALPTVDSDQARRIPRANLTLVARVAKNSTPKKVLALLAQAERTPIVEFKHEMQRKGLIPGKAEDPDLVALHLHVHEELAEAYKRLRGERTDDETLGQLMMGRPGKKAA
jgi:hypothetical protein